MICRNPKNERLKRQYADFLKHADGKAEQTIRQVSPVPDLISYQ